MGSLGTRGFDSSARFGGERRDPASRAPTARRSSDRRSPNTAHFHVFAAVLNVGELRRATVMLLDHHKSTTAS
eukprot:3093356-Pyramimonas_sp.AAC.1